MEILALLTMNGCMAMSDENFKEGDQSFVVNFEIITCTMLGLLDGFDAEEKQTDGFMGSKVYKTKKEAMTAAIDALILLRESVDE